MNTSFTCRIIHIWTQKGPKKLFRAILHIDFDYVSNFQKKWKRREMSTVGCRQIAGYVLHNEYKMMLWQQRWIGKVATAYQNIKSHRVARKQPNYNNEQRWWWQPTLWGRFHPNDFVFISHLEATWKLSLRAHLQLIGHLKIMFRFRSMIRM